MLGHRRRRWTNIKPALDQRLVFAGDRRSTSMSVTLSHWHEVRYTAGIQAHMTCTWQE